MELKKCVTLVAMGVGGTLLYQSIKNGTAKKYVNDMEKFVRDAYEDMSDDLEDMM